MSEIESWIIEKDNKGAYVLYHHCTKSRKSICCKLRNHEMWLCRVCMEAAPEEIGFSADLAPCKHSRPPLPRDKTEDEEFSRLLGEALRAK